MYHLEEPDRQSLPGEYTKDGEFKPKEHTEFKTPYPIFGAVEDLILGILRPVFVPMGVGVFDQHTQGMPLPLIIARNTRATAINGMRPADVRFMRSYKVAVSVLTNGAEADVQGAYLAEAVQHVMLRAWHEQVFVPGLGSIAYIDAWVDPSRVSDIQTATNIVQYPSLPEGTVRYEQNFSLLVRPDWGSSGSPFLANI